MSDTIIPNVNDTSAVITEAPKPASRKDRKAENKANNPETSLLAFEDTYMSCKSLYDQLRRAMKSDPTVTADSFFDGVKGKIAAVEATLDNLSKHRGYIPDDTFGYRRLSAPAIVDAIRGIAITASAVKTNAAKRADNRVRANKAAIK